MATVTASKAEAALPILSRSNNWANGNNEIEIIAAKSIGNNMLCE